VVEHNILDWLMKRAERQAKARRKAGAQNALHQS
jgi:hypothetical protein